MKVYEKINQLRGMKAGLREIANWFYMNRIYPYEVVYKNALGLGKNVKLPKELKNILMLYDSKVIMGGYDEIINMLNKDLIEEVSNE